MLNKQFILSALLLILLFSCKTTEISQENQTFQETTHIDLGSTLRPVYSLYLAFHDKGYMPLSDEIMDGNINFIAVQDVDYRAKVEKSDTGYTIYIDNIFDNYEDYESKVAYLVAIIATFGKMQIYTGIEQDSEFLEDRFYQVINKLSEWFVIEDILEDSLYTDREIVVEGNIIR